ncbi:MAG: hypothetical protein ACYTG5_02135 [Planctomycetota bacterium]|jgi:hypothetical protein
MAKTRALVSTWLQLDFFGEGRDPEQGGSSLTTTIFTQSFMALLFAALIFDGDAMPIAFAAANLSLSTMLVGMSAIADQETYRRRIADRVLLETAPISRLIPPLARALHSGFQICLVTIGMALPPGILLYWVSGHQLWVVPAYLILACALAGIFAASFHLLIRIMLRLLGQGRTWLIAGSMRGLLLMGLILAMATCLPHLQDTAADLPFGAELTMAWAPYWAARWLAAPIDGAIFLLPIIGLATLLYLAFAWIGSREKNIAKPLRSGDGILQRIDRSLARSGPLLGCTCFVAKMLYRSPGFRARVLPLFGLPLAMVLLAFWSEEGREAMFLLGVSLQFPAIYLPFLILFLPQADHEASAWLFETSPEHGVSLAREASLIALSTRILLPVHALALLIMLMTGVDWLMCISLAGFSWGTAVIVASIQIRNLHDMPFTVEGEALEGGMEFGGLVGLGMALAVIGGGFSLIAPDITGLTIGLVIASIAVLRLRSAPGRCHVTRNA